MSNVLADLLQIKDAETGDEFRELLQNVGTKLTQVKTDLVDSLQSSLVLYESDIDKVTSWYVEVLGIQDKVTELQDKFRNDREALETADGDILSLEEDLEQCENGIMLLRSLVDVVRSIEKADPSEFYKASKLVFSAKREFEVILEKFGSLEDHGWIVSIRSHLSDLITDIYEKSSKELRIAFHFHFGKSVLTINRKHDVDELIQTFINIGYCTRVVNKLANDIWQELLMKACSQEYIVEIHSHGFQNVGAIIKQEGDFDSIPVRDKDPVALCATPVPYCQSNGITTVKIVKTSTPAQNIEIVFKNIKNILAVFNDIFTENPDIMQMFSSILGPRIAEEMGNKCLKNLILRNANGDITTAKYNIKVMNDFLHEFKTTLNFSFPENSVFDEIQSNFDTLFLTQVKQDLLVKIRNLVKANLHDTQEIVWEDNSDSDYHNETLMMNPYDSSRCTFTVSKSVVEIIKVLQDHLKKYPGDISMCDAAFNLYLSLLKIPKYESDSGFLAPFSSVIIHNNCHYLSYHADRTFPMTYDKVPDLLFKATQAYSFMMRTVRTKLNSLITDGVNGIFNNDNETSVVEINNFLKIFSEFERIRGMLEVLVPLPILNRALATLVDHTVNEISSKVLLWDDISAACASKLASAFTQLAVETSQLFKGDSTNPREIEALTSKCVSKWNRFRMLTFVLTASMKEIEDKWVGGCGPLAVEFKPEELRKMVRALFQNTDRRAAFLASIK